MTTFFLKKKTHPPKDAREYHLLTIFSIGTTHTYNVSNPHEHHLIHRNEYSRGLGCIDY